MWRLNFGPYLTWAIAFAMLGVVFGYFTTSVKDILGSDTAIQNVLAAGATTPDELMSAFLGTILSLIGIIAAVPGVQTMVKLRAEEMDDRVEPIMATAESRARYYASNVGAGLGASAMYLLLAGVLVALFASRAGIGISLGEALLQAVVTVPAVWTVIAVSVAVIGARPQVNLAAWAGVLISFVLTLLGPSFGLPDWALAISPFWHVPHTAAVSPDFMGLVWIAIATVLFTAVGFVGFGHRDLAR